MPFDFDIENVKQNSIPHVDGLSRLGFYKESKDKTVEEFEDRFLLWVVTDVLSLDRMAAETRHGPVISTITSRIRKNIWGNCSRAERPEKEIRHKLTIEYAVICNGVLIISPETYGKLVIKSVYDDILCGVLATHKRMNLDARWPGYLRDVEEYLKRCKKCKELTN